MQCTLSNGSHRPRPSSRNARPCCHPKLLPAAPRGARPHTITQTWPEIHPKCGKHHPAWHSISFGPTRWYLLLMNGNPKRWCQVVISGRGSGDVVSIIRATNWNRRVCGWYYSTRARLAFDPWARGAEHKSPGSMPLRDVWSQTDSFQRSLLSPSVILLASSGS